MMFGHDFYHGIVRKYIVMFGNLFNELQIERYNDSGTKIQTLNVPIAYGPKAKYIARITSDPDLNREISITLPRLSFELTSLTYAPDRKLNTGLRLKRGINTGGTDFSGVYAPIPYDMGFSLSIMTKYAEDGVQLVEKIIPFFTPDFTVTVKALTDLSLNLDVPIELNGITNNDSYEGDFESRRVITWDLNFTVKGYLFGPVTKTKYITSAVINLRDETTDATVSTTTFTGNSEFGFTETLT
ncbi:hypothetical protein EBS02_00155 [bacterium]|nr:hypothetical protein [bacterium]